MNTQNKNEARVRPIGLLICLVGLIAIAFSITLRIEPSALFNDLLSQMHTSQHDLDQLAVHYQNTLIAALIVAGFVVDFVGPRLTLSLALLVAICGNYFFAGADSMQAISQSRVLIAFAHPFILISVMTLGTMWLPRRHYAFFIGLVFATLLLLPNLVSPYLSQINSSSKLHAFTLQINCVGTAIILFILFSLSAKNQPRQKINFKEILAPLKQYQIWLIAFVSLLGWVANTFLLNYGSIYLASAFHIPLKIADDTIKITFSCFALGAIFVGLFAAFLEKNRFIITAGYLLAAITFSIILFVPHLTTTIIASLLFLSGIFASVAVVCYAYAYDYCKPGRTGITFGLVACITTIGNTLMAKLIGKLLSSYTTYGTTPWHWIVALVPLALLIGAVIATSLRKPPFVDLQ